MKRKIKIRNRILSLALAVVLCTSGLITGGSLTVRAADIQSGLPTIVLGTASETPTIIGFGGNHWVVIGYDGTGVNSQNDTMTLLLARGSSLGGAKIDGTRTHNEYGRSGLKTKMNELAAALPTKEYALIIPVTLEGGSANQGYPQYDANSVAGDTVPDQRFWPLSVTEANELTLLVSRLGAGWNLRTPGNNNLYAAYVVGFGDVDHFGVSVTYDFVVRPAFKIDLTSVIFSSSNPGGKPASAGANLEAATPTTGALKLTVLDSALAGFTAVPTGINGNSITLGYSGVGTTANRISAVVKDVSGKITHVGMLVSAPAANGITTVELPSGFDSSNDKLYIFAETVNPPNYTDYASNLVEVPVEAQAVAPTGLTGAPCTNASNNDGKITGLTTDMEYSTDSTNWTAVTGTELTGLSAGNYMVRYKEKMDSSTVYLASPTASVTIGTYTPLGTVATPTANPAGGQVTAGTTITLNVAESGATIHYTIDSSVPTTTSPVYSTPITVNSAMTIKAVAVKAGMTDSAIMSESYTIASNPAAAKHTITLGASGDGTASGGGTFDENTTVTVTATANAGWSFKQWTEGGVGVSQSASYSFTVTAARSLTAEFIKNDTPAPPTISTSGRSSSSGGSSKADTSPVFARVFTKPEAIKHFNAALAAKPEGQTSLSFRARNFTSADKAAFVELADLAQKNGVTLTVHFDTVVGKAVTYRISVNPALVTTNLDLTAKIVGGKITLPKLNPAVEVAVLLPAGITIENLKITQNGKLITNAKPWLDKNGYVHFITTGGEIVLGK